MAKIPPVDKWGKPIEHLQQVVDNWIFNQTHREIIKKRMFNGEDLHSLADEYNMSYERAREIYYDGRKIIFEHKDYQPQK